jgi:hypothetical protein
MADLHTADEMGLIAVLERLHDLDEDTKKRHVIRPLTKKQAEALLKRYKGMDNDHLFPPIHPYIRTNRRTKKKFLVGSRRLHASHINIAREHHHGKGN